MTCGYTRRASPQARLSRRSFMRQLPAPGKTPRVTATARHHPTRHATPPARTTGLFRGGGLRDGTRTQHVLHADGQRPFARRHAERQRAGCGQGTTGAGKVTVRANGVSARGVSARDAGRGDGCGDGRGTGPPVAGPAAAAASASERMSSQPGAGPGSGRRRNLPAVSRQNRRCPPGAAGAVSAGGGAGRCRCVALSRARTCAVTVACPQSHGRPVPSSPRSSASLSPPGGGWGGQAAMMPGI